MIRVIIERKIAEGLETAYEDTALATLQKAVNAPGYIAGESMRNLKNARNRYIFTKWHSVEDWYSWANSATRKELINTMRPMLDEDERVILLSH